MRPLPHEEAARFDEERRANVDGVGERWSEPHEEAAKVDEERRANIDGVNEGQP
jgi:hypothetical protein